MSSRSVTGQGDNLKINLIEMMGTLLNLEDKDLATKLDLIADRLPWGSNYTVCIVEHRSYLNSTDYNQIVDEYHLPHCCDLFEEIKDLFDDTGYEDCSFFVMYN